MTQIFLDAALSGRLNELGQPAELCAPDGKVIGKFVPAADLSGWEPISPGITDEELARRSKSDEKRYSTAEVLAHLEKL